MGKKTFMIVVGSNITVEAPNLNKILRNVSRHDKIHFIKPNQG